jgi:hypothetical protein
LFSVPAPLKNSMVNSPPFVAVKRSPSMNDAHLSMGKYPVPSLNQAYNGKHMSDKISSRIAADKAAFFSQKQQSQQIYENIDKGNIILVKG